MRRYDKDRTSFSDGSAKGRKLKRCLAILLALIASFVVISGVIVVIYYFKNKGKRKLVFIFS